MDFKAYLHRIHCQEELSPSLGTLALLQKQHILHIPFENLDIHYGRPIVLNKDKIFDKVISKGRGGFCYELNGLFFELLSWIGFKTKMVSARVFDVNKFSEDFDHLAILVQLNGLNYLTDVGFGNFTIAPLLLHPYVLQHDESGDFRINQIGAEFIIYKYQGADKKPMYKFENIPRSIVDFIARCRYHQTSSESHFTQQKLITIATEQGRITLTDDKLKITKDSLSSEFNIKNEDEFKDKLWKYYNIKISE